MTTIAADGTRVAHDSASSIGDMRTERTRDKVRLVDGYLFGITGVLYALEPMIEWWLKGAKKESYPTWGKEDSFTFIVFFRDVCIVYTNETYMSDTRSYPTAFGSGMHYAVGAMRAAEDAPRAVQIACTLDVYSWAPVTHHDIPDVRSTDPRPPFKGKNKKHDPKLKPKARAKRKVKNGPNTRTNRTPRPVAKHGGRNGRHRPVKRVPANRGKRANVPTRRTTGTRRKS